MFHVKHIYWSVFSWHVDKDFIKSNYGKFHSSDILLMILAAFDVSRETIGTILWLVSLKNDDLVGGGSLELGNHGFQSSVFGRC